MVTPSKHGQCSTKSAPSIAYRVDLTERAARDLRHLYRTINGENSSQARDWFDGWERAILSLDENPARGPIIPGDAKLRHLLYGRRRNVYRIIDALDEHSRVVTVLHIRHRLTHMIIRSAARIGPQCPWRR